MGDVYPEIPDESLLVSDLVPVDHKIRLYTEILPVVLVELNRGDDAAAEKRLREQLQPFGEDPKKLVRDAALS